MAIAVATVGTAEYKLGSTSNFTVDFAKPSGLAEGDLMVGCFFTDAGSAPITTLTRSGWTANGPGEASAETSRLFNLYKLADSADVAASTFTFTTNYSGTGGGKVGGAILRVTGFGVGTTPVIATDVDNNRNGTGASFTSFTGTFTPADTDSLLVFMVAGTNNETGTGTMSGYTVSGSNPTWTEQFDIFDSDGDDSIFAVATTVDSTTTNRTTASVTCSVAQDDYLLMLLSFQAAKSASADSTLLTVTPAMFNAIATTADTATNNTLDCSPTIANATASSSSDGTAWTTITKN